MIIMAMKTLKTECFGQIWSNLAKFEAIIEAGRVKFAKKCDNNKIICFQLYRGLGAMAHSVDFWVRGGTPPVIAFFISKH